MLIIFSRDLPPSTNSNNDAINLLTYECILPDLNAKVVLRSHPYLSLHLFFKISAHDRLIHKTTPSSQRPSPELQSPPQLVGIEGNIYRKHDSLEDEVAVKLIETVSDREGCSTELRSRSPVTCYSDAVNGGSESLIIS